MTVERHMKTNNLQTQNNDPQYYKTKPKFYSECLIESNLNEDFFSQ